jgi:hypothetical protein
LPLLKNIINNAQKISSYEGFFKYLAEGLQNPKSKNAVIIHVILA